MKKLFKKSIACLIAVLMVVSTMPFTAITAQAADGYEVLGKVTIDPIIYTHGAYNSTTDSEYAYMMYGSTIADGSYDGECKTAVSSTLTISSVEAVGASGASVRVENGLLKGTLGSAYDGSSNADTTVTLKFTFSNGTYEYHKMPVKTNPVAQHVAGFAQRWTIGGTWKRALAVESLAVGSYGQTNSGSYSATKTNTIGASATHNYKKMYAPFNSDTSVGAYCTDKKFYGFIDNAITTDKQNGYAAIANGNNVNNVLTVNSLAAKYYIDLSSSKNYGIVQSNGGYYIDILVGKIYDNFNKDCNVRLDGRSATGLTESSLIGIVNSIDTTVDNGTDRRGYIRYKIDNPTAGSTIEATTYISYRSDNNTYAQVKLNLPINIQITDKSTTRNLYNKYIEDLDPRCYTAGSWATFRDALLTAEEFLNDNTDNSSDATAKSNLENARNALVVNSDSSVHNHYTDTITKQATCTENGSTKRTCTCGYSYTDNTIPAATGHTEVTDKAVAATCTSTGLTEGKHCSVCNTVLVAQTEIPATGVHNYTQLVSTKQEATCTSPGKEAVYKCATCDLTTGGEEIPAPGHTWGDWAYNEADNNEIRRCSVCNATQTRACTYKVTGTTTATCKVKGSTTYTCETCNHSYTNYGEVDPNNHVNTTHHDGQAATCTEDGWSDYEVCNDCNKEIGKTVNSATGHSLTKVDEEPSTCAVKGTAAYWTCTKCNKMFSDEQGKKEISAPVELPLADHSFTTYTQTLAPTCTTVGKEEAVCDNGCGTKDVRDVAINENAHNYGAWVDNKNGKNHTRTCLNNSEHTQTEVHNIVNGACTECGYVAFDMAAYNDAVAEYGEIIGAGDYAEKYTVASRTAYQEAVEAAKKNSFASQEEVDAAANAILSAKTKLVYAKADVKVYIAREGVNSVLVDTISKNYGETADINVADKLSAGEYILKWVIETQDTKVNTKLATTDTTVSMVVTEPANVYVHVASEVATESVQYSKVSFISKNGAVSFVKYVENGETLYTNTVDGVEIPFYKFVKWNKDSVVANGSDIEVKAVYEFVGTVENKCRVHYDGFDGGEKEYTYDSFVYLFGAEDKTLALSTDGTEANIITYLNENAFYAPHTADIYVIEVNYLQPASIGITGSYSTSTDTQTTYAFNCKLYVPAGCTVVEYGLIGTAGGVSKKIKAEKASDRGEFTIKITASGLSSMSGKAYLTYKTASGDFETIYSTTVTQA